FLLLAFCFAADLRFTRLRRRRRRPGLRSSDLWSTYRFPPKAKIGKFPLLSMVGFWMFMCEMGDVGRRGRQRAQRKAVLKETNSK
ncbi:MAG: hypothetical protein ABIJ44_02990, partial [Pseudomonadota bacterium]